jgi:hypothetical protein
MIFNRARFKEKCCTIMVCNCWYRRNIHWHSDVSMPRLVSSLIGQSYGFGWGNVARHHLLHRFVLVSSVIIILFTSRIHDDDDEDDGHDDLVFLYD